MKKLHEKTPLFVAISDIHFNINNLVLCSSVLTSAINKAEELDVPLIIAGDLNDTKAIIRAEVANKLIDILSAPRKINIIVIPGNHDLINEKNKEHSLNFIKSISKVLVVDSSIEFLNDLPGVVFMPYLTSSEEFHKIIQFIPKTEILVIHQGVKGALMGDYVVDKSAVDAECLNGFKAVYSGHYHRHQTIGNVTYIGSPFTMTFGEAGDGDKGFIVVNDDGSFTRQILRYRKHVIVNMIVDMDRFCIMDEEPIISGDLVWVKLRGSASQLIKVTKKQISDLLGTTEFKLDKIPIEYTPISIGDKDTTPGDLLDHLIDLLDENAQVKNDLKETWRGVA